MSKQSSTPQKGRSLTDDTQLLSTNKCFWWNSTKICDRGQATGPPATCRGNNFLQDHGWFHKQSWKKRCDCEVGELTTPSQPPTTYTNLKIDLPLNSTLERCYRTASAEAPCFPAPTTKNRLPFLRALRCFWHNELRFCWHHPCNPRLGASPGPPRPQLRIAQLAGDQCAQPGQSGGETWGRPAVTVHRSVSLSWLPGFLSRPTCYARWRWAARRTDLRNRGNEMYTSRRYRSTEPLDVRGGVRWRLALRTHCQGAYHTLIIIRGGTLFAKGLSAILVPLILYRTRPVLLFQMHLGMLLRNVLRAYIIDRCMSHEFRFYCLVADIRVPASPSLYIAPMPLNSDAPGMCSRVQTILLKVWCIWAKLVSKVDGSLNGYFFSSN